MIQLIWIAANESPFDANHSRLATKRRTKNTKYCQLEIRSSATLGT
jgi:hypothetical protein